MQINKNKKRSFLLFSILISLFFLISSNSLGAEVTTMSQSTTTSITTENWLPEGYSQLPTLTYNYYTPSWQQDYCNNTGMDFIIEIPPKACSPSPVTSDLLEEQDVPVYCKLTGIKINPLIQVPYIKSIVVGVENKSKQIAGVNFIPARDSISYYSYSKEKENLQGIPTMNNLGYLVLYLKQQKTEAEMPENVTAKLVAKIKYDISATFGINEKQIILPIISDSEWLNTYKKYSFWQGKGYLRAEDIKENSAKIALYTSQRSKLTSVDLNLLTNPKSKEIKLPYYYCGAGVILQLNEIDYPKTRARINVNGNELLLGQGSDEKILDSDCYISEINQKNLGSIHIVCLGTSNQYDLSMGNLEAKINLDNSLKDISLGTELELKKDGGIAKYYVSYIGTEYYQGNLENFIVLVAKKDLSAMKDQEKTKLSNSIDNFIKEQHKLDNFIDFNDATFYNKLKSYDSTFNDYFVNILTKSQETIEKSSLSLISVIGPIQITYDQKVEQAYKEAIESYKNIAEAHAFLEHEQGSVYGVVALKEAANLAKEFRKDKDQISLLKQLIEKYSTSNDPEIIGQVQEARTELLSLINSRGMTTTINSKNGNYLIQLIDIEKPSLDSLSAHIEVNDIPGTYTIGDFADEWEIQKIDESSVTFYNGSETKEIRKGNWVRVDENTKIKVLNTIVKREAKVTVLPFEKEHETITNFTVKIGIEKRTIKLSPEKAQETIEKLNKTIESFNKLVASLGKTIQTWKKVCYVGATTLWVKNFVTGLGGEAIARKTVMQYYGELCSDPAYRQKIIDQKNVQGVSGQELSISRCYQLLNDEINADVSLSAKAIQYTNTFIKNVKNTKGVVTSGGILGLSKVVNDQKFMDAVKSNILNDNNLNVVVFERKKIGELTQSDIEFYKSKNGNTLYTIDGRTIDLSNTNQRLSPENRDLLIETGRSVTSDNFANSIPSLYAKNYLFREDLKEEITKLYIYKECQNSQNQNSVLCNKIKSSLYQELSSYQAKDQEIKDQEAALNSLKDLGISYIPNIAKGEPIKVQKVVNTSELEFKAILEDSLKQDITSTTSKYYNKKATFIRYEGVNYLIIVSYTGSNNIYSIDDAIPVEFEQSKWKRISPPVVDQNADEKTKEQQTKNKQAFEDKIKEVKAMSIKEEDFSTCQSNTIKRPYSSEIKFWETGPYDGFVAYMPIDSAQGWYFATRAYTGLEKSLVAWTENADLNTFWICNVGLDGVPNFDYTAGAKGDDCCTQIVTVAGQDQLIGGLDKGSSLNLIEKGKRCVYDAIKKYSQGSRQFKTECGEFNLGKPPTSQPLAQCEDFMTPLDCRLMYNLCDPVLCPSSRCDFNGKYPVDNVIQTGVIGSIVLCWPNKGEVAVPVCLTGVHAGLDAFTKVLEEYQKCLKENIETGRMVGICDEIYSVYICEFFWNQLEPLIKLGIPAITQNVLGKGGGEYVLFSESWKNSINAAKYFTDFYALNSIKAFKARSVAETGTEICKQSISLVYPTQSDFLNRISQPESPTQATACLEVNKLDDVSKQSHYKIPFFIYAGKDQGVYYSIYLKQETKNVGYYQIPEIFQVKDGFGYLNAGESISKTPDFIAPSGYDEICIRINQKEICKFGGCATTSFAIDELQNYYLKDQLLKNIKTSKECVSGTASLFPTASLNIQTLAENAIDPLIYRRGIIRICSTINPGEATGESSRYKKVGYCDTKETACWLDMNSVKDAISDLGIKEDIAREVESKQITNAIESLGLKTPEQSIAQLNDLDAKFISLKESIQSLIESKRNDYVSAGTDTEKKNLVITNYKNQEEKKIEEIINLRKEYVDAIKFIAREQERARADEKIAQLLSLKALLLSQTSILKEDEKAKTSASTPPPTPSPTPPATPTNQKPSQDSSFRTVSKQDFANLILMYISDKKIAQIIMAIAIKEQSRGNNLNFPDHNAWGVMVTNQDQSKGYGWGSSRSQWTKFKFIAREGSTDANKEFVGFETYQDAFNFMQDVWQEKSRGYNIQFRDDGTEFARAWYQKWGPNAGTTNSPPVSLLEELKSIWNSAGRYLDDAQPFKITLSINEGSFGTVYYNLLYDRENKKWKCQKDLFKKDVFLYCSDLSNVKLVNLYNIISAISEKDEVQGYVYLYNLYKKPNSPISSISPLDKITTFFNLITN